MLNKLNDMIYIKISNICSELNIDSKNKRKIFDYIQNSENINKHKFLKKIHKFISYIENESKKSKDAIDKYKDIHKHNKVIEKINNKKEKVIFYKGDPILISKYRNNGKYSYILHLFINDMFKYYFKNFLKENFKIKLEIGEKPKYQNYGQSYLIDKSE